MKEQGKLLLSVSIIILQVLCCSCVQTGIDEKKEDIHARDLDMVSDTEEKKLNCDELLDDNFLTKENSFSYHKEVNKNLCVYVGINHLYDKNNASNNFKYKSILVLQYIYSGEKYLFQDSTSNIDFQFSVNENPCKIMDFDNDSINDFSLKYYLTGTDASTYYYIVIVEGKVYKAKISSTSDGLNSEIRESFDAFKEVFPLTFNSSALKLEYESMANELLQ